MSRKIEPQLGTKETKELYQVLASISEPKDMAKFLRDLLTIEEIKEAARRFQVVRMLKKGQSVRDIAQQVKMSSATISRINYWLHHGTGGYWIGLKKIAKD